MVGATLWDVDLVGPILVDVFMMELTMDTCIQCPPLKCVHGRTCTCKQVRSGPIQHFETCIGNQSYESLLHRNVKSGWH